MRINQTCRHMLFLLSILTAIYLTNCTSGWYGTTARIQQSQYFEKKRKSEIIEKFGIPDSSFIKEEGVEHWLYKSYNYSYFIFGGKKNEKGLILKFKNNYVLNTYFVDQGILGEIATRGWEYLELI